MWLLAWMMSYKLLWEIRWRQIWIWLTLCFDRQTRAKILIIFGTGFPICGTCSFSVSLCGTIDVAVAVATYVGWRFQVASILITAVKSFPCFFPLTSVLSRVVYVDRDGFNLFIGCCLPGRYRLWKLLVSKLNFYRSKSVFCNLASSSIAVSVKSFFRAFHWSSNYIHPCIISAYILSFMLSNSKWVAAERRRVENTFLVSPSLWGSCRNLKVSCASFLFGVKCSQKDFCKVT